ncbi:MAG TPA: FAD/NAD(P)-binding protein, partial [Terriglobia bacterium]|nr:FAD/NAD(P)-binding protein [Terriglobia bacterium]
MSIPDTSVSMHPMVPRPYRITRRRRETQDTFTVELQPSNGSGEFRFAAGQFNMLYVWGVGEVAISISGDPKASGNLIHTIRSVGTVTNTIQNLKAGDELGVRGPYGSWWPVEAAAGGDVVFVAGGLGLAPLRPAIYQVLAERKRYQQVALLYGARSPADILFKRELERWRARFDLQVRVAVDRADPEWMGSVGVVTRLISRVQFNPQSTTAMICGPEVMMRFTAMELEKLGMPAKNMYISMERNMKCALGLCGHCQ